VRDALGRQGRYSVSPRINVSSCKLVVTLHGIAGSVREKDEIEAAVRAVPGVRDVIPVTLFPNGPFGVSGFSRLTPGRWR
jgi:osmotically-inducible protein OsmY